MNPSRHEALREGAAGPSGAPVSSLLSAHHVMTDRASVPARTEGGAR